MLSFLRRLIPNRHPIRLAWHHGKALAAAIWYGFPARNLTIIGITGTDGKTTTVGMLAHIFEYSGIRAGALSTAFFRIGNAIHWNATQKTSPSPFAIQRFLRECVKEHCTHAVLECSSHGLVQGRLNFTWPTVAAITNVTPEHLDYHGSLEQYVKDKGLLFMILKKSGTKILNKDDDFFEEYARIPSSKIRTYSLSDPIVQTIELQIPGNFNIENALCAIQCAKALGLPSKQSIEALKKFTGIPGRMEWIDEGQTFSVFIDFTVTPAAYEKTLHTARSMLGSGKRLLVLTGSCGDRMREKRPVIGKICAELADTVVVTNEDPYTEDPEQIINEVWQGIEKNMKPNLIAKKIPDRRDAISFLLTQAKPGDIVLLCGKGSDTTMWMKEGQVPWNEREIVREILRK
ncbi:hypothetical protein A2635_02690 [Candidatus Peribacteria bacterium RIFCSPHIGHO2_01_FULL_51_9]|nr:MAG: hypothetical protein A2635_02690 [Candidatus Peribacteria bacterium RIFCSPHIGHO2_01_FULL_51_9]